MDNWRAKIVFSSWHLVFGIWYLVFGIWYLVFGQSTTVHIRDDSIRLHTSNTRSEPPFFKFQGQMLSATCQVLSKENFMRKYSALLFLTLLALTVFATAQEQKSRPIPA